MATSENLNGANAGTAKLFNNPLLSDITIRQTCNGVTKMYHAHRPILASHSDWFMRAFTGNFKEATDKIIEIHDDDPDQFEAMIRYFYSDKWSKDLEDPTNTLRCLLDTIGVYALADKYGCESLKHAAAEKFKIYQRRYRLSVSDTKQVVEAHYQRCVEVECKMGRAIALSLRRADPPVFIINEECSKLAKRYPEFGRDLFLDMQAEEVFWAD